jgi:hypothetical protein
MLVLFTVDIKIFNIILYYYINVYTGANNIILVLFRNYCINYIIIQVG